MSQLVLSIGHSNHPYQRFLALLQNAGVDAVVDIRSVPYSRRLPHFNTGRLNQQLRHDAIEYAFLGAELGGRPADPQLYAHGRADYERMAETPGFLHGLDSVLTLAQHRRPALVCSERDPLDCHRCLLVGRALAQRGVPLQHILLDGQQISQQGIEDHLLELLGGAGDDLFASREQRLAAAYRARSARVAFAEPALRH